MNGHKARAIGGKLRKFRTLFLRNKDNGTLFANIEFLLLFLASA